MKSMFVAAMVAGLSLTSGFAQAMPLGASDATSPMVTQVAQGCGPGMARGPYGRCRPMMMRPMRERMCPPRMHMTPRGCRPNF